MVATTFGSRCRAGPLSSNSFSPDPAVAGWTNRCSSSSRPASRSCRTTDTDPLNAIRMIAGSFLSAVTTSTGNNTVAEQRRRDVGDLLERDEGRRTLQPTDVGGGNCAFYKVMWQELGGFDEQLTGGGNDTAFFLRASAAGYECRWAPSAILDYHMPTTAKTAFKRRQLRLRGHRCQYPDDPISPPHGQALALARLPTPRDLDQGRGWYSWLHIAGKRYAEASRRLSRRHIK